MQEISLTDVASDVGALTSAIKASTHGMREAVFEYFTQLAQDNGYEAVADASVVADGVDYGRLDLSWPKPQLTVSAEFGPLDNIWRPLVLNTVVEPALAVFVLSSRAHATPTRVYEIIKKTRAFSQLRGHTLLIDVAQESVTAV